MTSAVAASTWLWAMTNRLPGQAGCSHWKCPTMRGCAQVHCRAHAAVARRLTVKLLLFIMLSRPDMYADSCLL
jgi:hypothetical protein